MKKLLFFAIVVFAAWYGWNHRDTLLHRPGSHDAVLQNDTGEDIQRVRLTVDGQTLVKESLPEGQSATLPFQITHDSDFQLEWQWVKQPGERHWRGGSIAKGPLLQRHIFKMMDDGSVIYSAESKMVGSNTPGSSGSGGS